MLMAHAVLPMLRARGDDDQLGLLQTAGHAVEVLVVRVEAGDLAALLVELSMVPKESADDLRNAGEAAGDAALGHFQQV